MRGKVNLVHHPFLPYLQHFSGKYILAACKRIEPVFEGLFPQNVVFGARFLLRIPGALSLHLWLLNVII
jgi:hypothetical protein